MRRVVGRHRADDNHEVVTLVDDGGHRYRRQPCAECPWRTDAAIEAFPPEAYRHSATTAYDMATNTFACHMSGSEKPADCAGFLLRGAAHNMGVRMKIIRGEYDPREVSTDVELYRDYRDMAEANGVDPDDPALRACRGRQ